MSPGQLGGISSGETLKTNSANDIAYWQLLVVYEVDVLRYFSTQYRSVPGENGRMGN